MGCLLLAFPRVAPLLALRNTGDTQSTAPCWHLETPVPLSFLPTVLEMEPEVSGREPVLVVWGCAGAWCAGQSPGHPAGPLVTVAVICLLGALCRRGAWILELLPGWCVGAESGWVLGSCSPWDLRLWGSISGLLELMLVTGCFKAFLAFYAAGFCGSGGLHDWDFLDFRCVAWERLAPVDSNAGGCGGPGCIWGKLCVQPDCREVLPASCKLLQTV